MKKLHLISLVLLAMLSLGSCKPEDDQEKKVSADQASFLNNYAYNIITPAYTVFQDDVMALEQAIQSYTKENHEQLKPLIDSAYNHWQACAMFDFGPASTYSLDLNINIFPLNETTLSTAIDIEKKDLSASSDADIKGLPALDHLIYANDTLTTKQLSYIKLIIDDIQYRVDNTLGDWNESYASYFVSNIGYDAGSSVCFLMNGYIKYYEKPFRDGKLGIPLGMRTLGDQNPDKIEALTSNQATSLLKTATKELKEVYYGKNGLGFDYLLKSDDSSMEESTLNAIDALWTKIDNSTQAINQNLDDYVLNNQAEGKLVYADIQELLVYLKINMIQSLSLRIKYVDQDGD